MKPAHRIDLIGLALVAATALTWWVGEHPAAQGLHAAAVVLVLGLAVLKGALIVLDYMELRHAPPLWRRLLLGWLGTAAALILAATLWSL